CSRISLLRWNNRRRCRDSENARARRRSGKYAGAMDASQRRRVRGCCRDRSPLFLLLAPARLATSVGGGMARVDGRGRNGGGTGGGAASSSHRIYSANEEGGGGKPARHL